MLRAAVRPELFRTPENFSDRPRTIAEHLWVPEIRFCPRSRGWWLVGSLTFSDTVGSCCGSRTTAVFGVCVGLGARVAGWIMATVISIPAGAENSSEFAE